jgi:hypothetical protein
MLLARSIAQYIGMGWSSDSAELIQTSFRIR